MLVWLVVTFVECYFSRSFYRLAVEASTNLIYFFHVPYVCLGSAVGSASVS